MSVNTPFKKPPDSQKTVKSHDRNITAPMVEKLYVPQLFSRKTTSYSGKDDDSQDKENISSRWKPDVLKQYRMLLKDSNVKEPTQRVFKVIESDVQR